LSTESCITQTWAARCKAFAASITSTIAAWLAVTAKSWLVTKLAAGLAIATKASGGGFGTLLAWAVITAHSHDWAWCSFGFDWGNFGHGLCSFGRVVGWLLCVCISACIVRAVGSIA
jgi:hypothetical protein